VSKKATKRTKAATALPLDSPHWWPREKTMAYCCEHKGDRRGAALALLAAFNQGEEELPVKAEWFDQQTSPPVPHKKVLSAEDYELKAVDFYKVWLVQPRRPDVPVLDRPALFFWGPKVKQLWPMEEEVESVRTEQQAVDPLAPPPRRRGRPTTHDWHSIDGEIARRCIDPKTKRVAVPENENKLAEAVLGWLSGQGIDPPAPSEMREAVKRVCAALRLAQ
jgi:hypothetical protein